MSDEMSSGEKFAMVLGILVGGVLGFFTTCIGCHADFEAQGGQMIRNRACASACERRDTAMSHTHGLMCVCENGHTLTLDYGAMYRPMEE